jgi:hypothetical protein
MTQPELLGDRSSAFWVGSDRVSKVASQRLNRKKTRVASKPCGFRRSRPLIPRWCRPAIRDDVAWLAGALLAVDFWQSCGLVINPLASIWSGGVSDFRRRDRCDGRCVQGGRGWRRHKPGRRTRCDAIIAERQLPRIRVIDAVHPLFGQPLEVSPSGLIRRIGWIRVVLPDGRHRWVPQKVTDLNVSACEARPNRDLPLVSVRTLIPLAEYVRARLSALGERFDETSGHTADPAVRAGIAGSKADLGAEIVADDDRQHNNSWRSGWHSYSGQCWPQPTPAIWSGGITMNMLLNLESPVTTAHRANLAYIYVRQSTAGQVRQHQGEHRAAVSAGRSCSLVRLAQGTDWGHW